MYKITNVTDRKGNIKNDAIKEIMELCPEMKGEILYPGDSGRMMRTSLIEDIEDDGNVLHVTTINTEYWLEKVEENIEMKNSIDYNSYVGRYFKRNTGDCNYVVFKILAYDGRYFRTDSYYLTLGSSTKEENCRYLVSFLEADNFEEIDEKEFMTVVGLCDRPYTVKWDENDEPTYC